MTDPAKGPCPEKTYHVPAGTVRHNNITADNRGDRIGYGERVKGFCAPAAAVSEQRLRPNEPLKNKQPWDPATSVTHWQAKQYCESQSYFYNVNGILYYGMMRLPTKVEVYHAYHRSYSRDLSRALAFLRLKKTRVGKEPYHWIVEEKGGGKLRVSVRRTKHGIRYTAVRMTENDKGAPNTSFFCVADKVRKPAKTESDGWPECNPEATKQKLSFVHWNDLHDSYDKEKWGNRFALIKGFCNAVRAENPYTVCTDGGDVTEKGVLAALISGGFTTLLAYRAMAPDLGVIGNHDAAWSYKYLLGISNSPKTFVLASNMTYVGDNPEEYGGLHYAIVQIGCVKVGFLGMTPKSYNEMDDQIEDDHYPDKLHANHSNYAQRRDEIVAKLKAKGVRVIVMVSHLGVEEDRRLAGGGLSAILSSHSHDNIAEVVNGVPIIQAGSYAESVGRLDLDVDLKTGKVKKHDMIILPTDRPYFFMPNDDELAWRLNTMVDMWHPKDEFAYIGRSLDSKDEIAEVVGKSILHHLKEEKGVTADGALVDTKAVWMEKWEKGTMTLGLLSGSFKSERQPANNPGFSSFNTVTVSGSELEYLRRSGLWNPRWVYVGLTEPDPDGEYTLAVERKAAKNLMHYFGIEKRPSQEMCEIWEAVYSYGTHRTEEGMCIDEDVLLEDCASDS